MSRKLILHELTSSPNNVKARIGLGYKNLPYERVVVPLDGFPGERGGIVALSRQPRLPVLQDGDTVIFDSGAILRYLEANFPDTPRLFTNDYAAHAEIERWELYARNEISKGVGLVFGQAFAPSPDQAVLAQARQALEESTEPIEERLAASDFLVENALTAGDIAGAALLYLADVDATQAEENPISALFHRHFQMPETRPRTLAWMRRVVAHDSVKGARYVTAV